MKTMNRQLFYFYKKENMKINLKKHNNETKTTRTNFYI